MYFMFVGYENQTLYPSTLEYNYCLIMNELTRIAENNGAIIKPSKGGFIVNRSILEEIKEAENRIDGLTRIANKPDTTEKAKTAIEATIRDYQARIEELKSIPNDPVRVDHTYIIFVLNGVYYYYSFPDNPFFDNYFTKTPVFDDCKVSRDCYGSKDNKEWFFDSLWRSNCSHDDIKEAANMIFNMMLNSGYSKKYRDGSRRRVPNTYDGGYHYETIYKPERIEKLEWLTVNK